MPVAATARRWRRRRAWRRGRAWGAAHGNVVAGERHVARCYARHGVCAGARPPPRPAPVLVGGGGRAVCVRACARTHTSALGHACGAGTQQVLGPRSVRCGQAMRVMPRARVPVDGERVHRARQRAVGGGRPLGLGRRRDAGPIPMLCVCGGGGLSCDVAAGSASERERERVCVCVCAEGRALGGASGGAAHGNGRVRIRWGGRRMPRR